MKKSESVLITEKPVYSAKKLLFLFRQGTGTMQTNTAQDGTGTIQTNTAQDKTGTIETNTAQDGTGTIQTNCTQNCFDFCCVNE